jgi:hypothetical protein
MLLMLIKRCSKDEDQSLYTRRPPVPRMMMSTMMVSTVKGQALSCFFLV